MAAPRNSARIAITLIVLFTLQTMYPALNSLSDDTELLVSGRNTTIWTGNEQPWPQYGDNPTRNFTIPAHSTTGGQGQSQLGTISEPVVNWVTYAEGDYGVQSYGTAIANLSSQITRTESALERCGQGNLFAVFTVERSSDSSNDWLVIVEGGLNKEAWRVDLGETEDVKSTPAIVDVDGDGMMEIILAYDTSAGLTIDAWAPRLTCSDAGWVADGHLTELLWSYTDPDLQIGIGGGFANGNHEASTQALVADLQMDGVPELVLTTVDDATGNPTVITFPLGATAPPDPLWEIQLDYGTHPSDPTWVSLDETTSAIMLTTIDENDGNMWAWKLQGATGSPDWNARSLISEGDSAVPHIRLPGPVIAQLDSDSLPEIIFTAPGDWDGSAAVDAASYHAWELTDGTEKWSFTASNGYADAPPTAIDENDDGVADRVCWITWFEDGLINEDRHGRIGCHDISSSEPEEIWRNSIEPEGSSPNEGIALSAPFALDIDGVGAPETVVAYGEMLLAFDGEDGHNDVWESSVELERRCWVQPSVADMDGDGLLDILIGDILVSQANVDIAPLLDNRGISFSPSVADPGENVVITAQYANQGTISTDGAVDAVLYVDDVEIGRHRVEEMQPGNPTGTVSDSAFSVDWIATLGTHQVRLELDPYSNVSQSRTDNDVQQVSFTVVEPYDLVISTQSGISRIDPGGELDLDINIQASGRRSGEWSLILNRDNLPENWTVEEVTPLAHQGVMLDPNDTPWSPNLRASVPETAQGSETGSFVITMTLDENPSINISALIPLEVNRTRGLSLVGPDGSAHSIGHGIEGRFATAWFQIENLGNAEERLTSLTWSSNEWGEEPQIHDEGGGPYFTLTLEPGEKRELYAKVMVPADKPMGDIANSDLTACIGTGDDFECQQIGFEFSKNRLSVIPPHIRSLPGVDLQFELGVDSSAGDINIDLADAGMMQPDWNWNIDGEGELNGSILTIPQSAEISTTWMNVSIDSQSPPQLHLMETSVGSDSSLNLSIQILQKHDASIEVVDPTSDLMIADVETWSTFVVRIVNKGNAPDSFELDVSFMDSGDITVNPGVEFSIAQPIIELGVDASALPPIDYRLPAGTPAGQELVLRVEIRSTLNSELFENTELRVSAKQDHNWSVGNVSHTNASAAPGSEVAFSFSVANTGNLEDLLSWQSTTEIKQAGSDSSEWNFDIDEATVQQVGEEIQFNISTIVPDDAWSNSIAYYNLSAISDDTSAFDLNFVVAVDRISGWSLDLSGSSLDVAVTGSNITISVHNNGNAVVAPIVIPVMPTGWNSTNASLLTAIEPGAASTTTITLIPPSDGLAGEVGMLTLIVKDGDTLDGRTAIDVPLRIASHHQTEVGFDAGYGGEWVVTSQGGMPLAWITNTGNALSSISIDITPPEGWGSEYPDAFYLAAGQTLGLPINLVPPVDWDFANFTQEVGLTDPSGITHVVSLNVHSLAGNQNLSWATSPVLSGIKGDSVPVTLYGDSTTYSSSIELAESGIGTYPPCDDGNCAETLVYRSFVREPAVLEGSCSVEEPVLTNIESSGITNTDTAATCVLAYTEFEVHWTMTIRVDGMLISSRAGAHIGNTTAYNLTLQDWTPTTGSHTVVLDLYDAQGRIIDTESSTIIISATGWNIGISSVDESNDGEEITVNMRRSNYEQLTGIHCVLSATSEEWAMDWHIDMASGTLAPTLSFPRPAVENANIEFTLACEPPFDVDDDPADDGFTHILSERENIPLESMDWVWGAGAALTVLFAAHLLGFLQLKPRVPAQARRQRRSEVASPPQETETPPVSSETESPTQVGQDIHFDGSNEDVEASEEDEELIEERDEIDEVVDIASVEHETVDDEIDAEEHADENTQEDIDSKIERMMSRERLQR